MPLTPREITQITSLAAHVAEPRGASIEALRLVQERNGWVSDAQLRSIADLLGMSPDDLDGVATFYNLIFRRPVGRHVILACDSVSCWLCGCTALRNQLAGRLGTRPGETTADGRFTLLPIVCLGACDRAPALMIDTDLHGPVRAEGLDALLAWYP